MLPSVGLQTLHVKPLPDPFYAPKQPLGAAFTRFFSAQTHSFALLCFEVFFFVFFRLFLVDVAVNQSGVGPIRHLIFLNNLLSAV